MCHKIETRICRLVALRQRVEEKLKGQGRVDERCGTTRTDEVGKWDERPREEVQGNGGPHCRSRFTINWNLEVSLIVTIKARSTMEVSLIVIIKQVSS